MPQAWCIVFVPTFYYPALSYTEDADSFYLHLLPIRKLPTLIGHKNPIGDLPVVQICDNNYSKSSPVRVAG